MDVLKAETNRSGELPECSDPLPDRQQNFILVLTGQKSKTAIYVDRKSLCFQNILDEGKKTSGVDIKLMLTSALKCHSVIQQLCEKESDSAYTELYQTLRENVESHISILQDKIKQLNGARTDQEVPTNSVPKAPAEPVDIEKEKRRCAIEGTIIRKGGLTFQHIAGLNEAKQALTEAIIMPLQFPHLFTGCIKPWKRILLYGPPGTGKSRLAQAVAAGIDSTFYCVSSSDLTSSWVGESEKLIKELFQHATSQTGRSVIFIDEIDSICRQRNLREEEHTRRMKTELLKQMEGADNSSLSDKIFLLCATNCPWELDTAFLRRFQKRIYIPLPDEDARLQLIKIHTSDNPVLLSNEEWKSLVGKTDGYSGSDIANMTLGALFGPLRELPQTTHWLRTKDGKFTPSSKDQSGDVNAKISQLPADKIQPRQVNISDFWASIQTHRRTVTDDEIVQFDKFTSNFGENG